MCLVYIYLMTKSASLGGRFVCDSSTHQYYVYLIFVVFPDGVVGDPIPEVALQPATPEETAVECLYALASSVRCAELV